MTRVLPLAIEACRYGHDYHPVNETHVAHGDTVTHETCSKPVRPDQDLERCVREGCGILSFKGTRERHEALREAAEHAMKILATGERYQREAAQRIQHALRL